MGGLFLDIYTTASCLPPDCVVVDICLISFLILLNEQHLRYTKLTCGASTSLHERPGWDAGAEGVTDSQLYELCCLCGLMVYPFIGGRSAR